MVIGNNYKELEERSPPKSHIIFRLCLGAYSSRQRTSTKMYSMLKSNLLLLDSERKDKIYSFSNDAFLVQVPKLSGPDLHTSKINIAYGLSKKIGPKCSQIFF